MRKSLFIGQAMPRVKSHPHDWPTLNSWLYSVGISDNQIRKYFFYSALVDYFPGAKNGSHNIPTKDEIGKERKRLIKTIMNFNPKIVVPIGRLSISYCLNQKALPLKKNIGRRYLLNPYEALDCKKIIIPLPHPSRASTWYNRKDNKVLLDRALRLLKGELIK